MTNAHIKTYAASVAQGSRLARLARRGVAVCVLACVGMGAAQAQYHGRRDEAQLPPPPSARGDRLSVPQIDQPRGFEQHRDQVREQQREERRHAVQMMQQEGAREGARRGGRLTPDERRELRRQVNEAQMDIYPNRERR